MTVIAWDGKTIAADRQMSFPADADSSLLAVFPKLYRLDDGSIGALVGDARGALALLEWKQGNREFPKDYSASGQLIVWSADGLFAYAQRDSIALKCYDQFAAFGSGASIALGAMAAGATAEQAAHIACRYEKGCGLGVDTMQLNEASA